MKITKNKTIATLIALILTLTITIPLTALPMVNAHSPPWNVPTYAYIAVTPNPIGVGQQALVVYWMSQLPPTATGDTGYRWQNLKIEITKPDGSKQTMGPYTSDPVGGGFASFTPDQEGTYTFDFSFPEQVLTLYNPQNGLPGRDSANINDTYLASSASTTLTVQQEVIPNPRVYPLPTEYWTRPIEGQNTEWYALGSHWLGGSHLGGYNDLWQRDGIAPNSPHIMWTRPIEFGGVVGGTTGVDETGFYSGGAYEGRMTSAMVISGKLYFQQPLNHANGQTAPGSEYICLDLRTGEKEWSSTDIAGSTIKGQLFNYESMNQHGVVGGTIWKVSGTTWIGFDAFTGKWIYNLTSVPTGFEVYTKAGEIVRYVLNYNTNTKSGSLALWNNTAEHQGLHGALGSDTSGYQWRPAGKNVNMSQAYTWNVTISADIVGSSAPTIVKVIPGDLILGRSSTFTRTAGTPDPFSMWAISDKPETRGQLLWKKNYPAPAGNVSQQLPDGVPIDTVNRVFFMAQTETIKWLGYSLDTGDLLWGPVGDTSAPYEYYGGGFGGGPEGFPAYGNIYTQSYGGDIQCIAGNNGTLLWRYNNTQSGSETPWGLRPIFIAAIADGKVYAFNNEHSPNYPLYKGHQIYCLNASTGEEIYTMLSWAGQIGGAGTSSSVVADGFLAYYNYYDNRVYSVGKGPSSTTISASPKVSVYGNSVLVEGSVIDTASGTKQDEQAARFPNGVPAVADENMNVWMEYVYMQKPKPDNVKGVEVVVSVLDPNNNYYEVGRTTSDASGMFKLMFTPEVPGEYSVTARFEGSESYWPSQAQTGIGVSDAPTPSSQPETAIPDNTSIVIGAAVAIIIAIAIVGAVLALMIRKRP
jgi:outer membrane protein assembly factor BamB